MAWFGESSEGQEKNDMESLSIRFETILFYPDRNEYELCIDLSGCPKDVVKATYEMGKLKVEGEKYQREFVQEFSIPADCVPTGIYGQYQGEVLHIIMPRLLSEWPRYEEDDRQTTTEVREDRDVVKDLAGRNSSSRQKEDDVNASFDREKLTGKLPTLPLSSDRKSTEHVNEKGGEERNKLASRVSAPSSFNQKERKGKEGKDRDNLLILIPTLLSSYQKEREGKDRDKLPARVRPPSPSPSPSPSDPKPTEKLRPRDSKLFSEISAAPERSRSVKKPGENYQRNLSKTVAPPPPPPPSLPHAAAITPWNQKATKIRQEDIQKPSSTALVRTSPSSYPKESKKKDVESDKPVIESQKNDKKSELENAKSANIVTDSKDKEESKEKKPSSGGNKMLGLVAKVKETGEAAVSAAMKEENRLVVMIGAVVLSIIVLGGASWRRKKKQKLINM